MMHEPLYGIGMLLITNKMLAAYDDDVAQRRAKGWQMQPPPAVQPCIFPNALL